MGSFQIRSCFTVSRRGVFLAGKILDGTINKGAIIKFSVQGYVWKKTIKAVELIRSSDSDVQIGISLSPLTEEEKASLLEWEPNLEKASFEE